jgi:hypothetical protein
MTETSNSTASRFGAAAKLAEQGFLAAGESLEGAVTILDRLTERFGEYVAGLDAEAFDDTRRSLTAAGAHVAALSEGRRSDAAALAALVEIVGATERRIVALQPIAQEVEALSLHARVVAGGMGGAAADFVAFAGSIRDAAQDARCSLAQASDALQRVHQDVTAAGAQAGGFTSRFGDALRSIPSRLTGNLRSLTAQQQLASDAATAARYQSEAVRRQVAEQIFALQLGDITRQRVEHVAAALQFLAERPRDVGSLLAAQLTDTADQLQHDGERIEAGLRQLAEAARAIGQLGIQLHGDASHGGFIAALEADIRQTATLSGELSAADAETDRYMAAVLEGAGTLETRLASVQSVQEDIRIMGLNATLKCGRLGTVGRALAVVAQELRLCSERFGVHAASVLHDLDRLESIAGSLQDPSRRGEHTQLTQAIEQMLAPLRRLGQLQDELATSLTQLRADSDEVGRLVEIAVSQFAVRHALAQTLRTEATEFASWSDTGDGGCSPMERIASTYTMAREREIHARFAAMPLEMETADSADGLF